MTSTEAAAKSCPFDQKHHCQVAKCMAWQATNATEGFCLLLSRSRTVLVSPQSAQLGVALQDPVAISANHPLEIRIEQREYDCFEVRVKE